MSTPSSPTPCPPPEHADACAHTSHDHAAHGGHSHAISPDTNLQRLLIVLGLTATVLIAELVGAYISSSLSLWADAGHMAIDSLGLIVATATVIIARRPRSHTYTWGWARVEAISAAFQASLLLVVAGTVALKAVGRLQEPVTILPKEMAIFAVVGLVANVIGLVMLMRSQHDSLNMRAAFLEVLNDTLGSVMVLVAAGAYAWLQWSWADAVASLLVAALMAPRALTLLRQSLAILLESTPKDIDIEAIRALVLAQDHVVDMHDVHISTIATGIYSLTAHVTLSDACFNSGHSLSILHTIQDALATSFPVSINHCTIQIESESHRAHETLSHQQTIVPHQH